MNVKLLFDAYRQWCEIHGIRAGSSIVLGRNLRAVRPEISTGGRGKGRFYTGVRLSKEGRRQYDNANSGLPYRR